MQVTRYDSLITNNAYYVYAHIVIPQNNIISVISINLQVLGVAILYIG